MSLAEFFLKKKFIANLIREKDIGIGRDKKIVDSINRYLKPKANILDIGCGVCRISKMLAEKGHKIVPLDVQDLSIYQKITPIIYDGNTIPFKNNSFDYSLLLYVLHHTKNPEAALKEAKRVSKKIIVIEDIYHNKFHKYLTFFADSCVNLEFIGHPHSNKSDTEWKKTFKKHKLKLIDTRQFWTWGVFMEKVYFLSK